jgi:hypothetical protein
MNEQKVISIVTTAPFSRIGKNSTAFWKNMAGSPYSEDGVIPPATS